MEFYKLKDYDSLAMMDSKMLQTMVEDFVMTKKSEEMTRAGITNYIAPLELFCDTNDLDVKWKKIHRLLPSTGKKSGGKPYTTEQISLMLQSERDIRNKAIVHFIASSGIRVGAIEGLRIKHVVDFKEGCKKVMVYADTKDEYLTFLTPEASSVLDQYIDKRKNNKEYLTDESPLFRISHRLRMEKAKPMKTGSIVSVIERVVKRIGLRNGKITKRYDTQLDHGFRKRWNTIVKNTDGMKIILAEKMMGHAVTIRLDDTYNVPDEERLFAEFRKAIPELTIDSSARKQAELEAVKSQITEIEKTKSENKDLQREMDKNETKFQEQIENLQDQLKRKDDMATNAILDLQHKVSELEKKSRKY